MALFSSANTAQAFSSWSHFYQSQGVDAIAQATGCGAVGEDVAQVGIADIASGFYARHTVAVVGGVGDDIRRDGLGEAGPTTLAVKLGAGIKQLGTTAHAAVAARLE